MSDKTITSIERGISVIDLLIENGGMTQSEIGKELDWSKTNVHYYVKTLEKKGLITQRDGICFAGLGFASYGKAAIEQTELANSLNSVVSDLAEETNKLSLLAVEQNNKIYYIYQRSGSESQIEQNLIGKAREPHCTAFGKAIMAGFEERRLEEVLENTELRSYTNNTITSRERLRQELEKIRENDFAYSEGEFKPSIRGIASPIWDKDGEHLLGSIGIIGSEEALENPYSGRKAQRFAHTDANIVKRFAKMARNNLMREGKDD